MPAPMGKKERYPSATRPWLGGDPIEESSVQTRETPIMEAEREICLACQLPDCWPSSKHCPLNLFNKNWRWGPVTIPEDFAGNAETMTRAQLAEHYGVSEDSIKLWAARIKTPKRRRNIPIPESIRYYGRIEPPSALAVRYGVSETTVRRWLKVKNVTKEEQ